MSSLYFTLRITYLHFYPIQDFLCTLLNRVLGRSAKYPLTSEPMYSDQPCSCLGRTRAHFWPTSHLHVTLIRYRTMRPLLKFLRNESSAFSDLLNLPFRHSFTAGSPWSYIPAFLLASMSNLLLNLPGKEK